MNRHSAKSPKLLDQVREKLRIRHYAWRTEQAYVMWLVKFLKFHRDRNNGRWRHPRELGKAEIEQFLTSLAINKRVAASTQNQALAAILFLYRNVLDIKLPNIEATRVARLVQSGLAVLRQQQDVSSSGAEVSLLPLSSRKSLVDSA